MIIRGFSFGTSTNWLPLLDIKEIYDKSVFWFIGVQDEEVYGVELKQGITEPSANQRLPTKVHKLKIPLIKTATSESEEKVINNKFFINHDIWRTNNYSIFKETRNPKMPDHYYSDSIKDVDELTNVKKEYDRFLLGLMNEYVAKNQVEKISDIFDSLLLVKSRELAIKFVSQLNESSLAQILNAKMERIKVRESQLSNHGNINADREEHQQPQHRNNEKYNNSESKEKNEGSLSVLSSFAINIHNNFKDLEEEVRNELDRNGNNEEKGEKFEDNALNLKHSNLSFEKKTVKSLLNFSRVIHFIKMTITRIRTILTCLMI